MKLELRRLTTSTATIPGDYLGDLFSAVIAVSRQEFKVWGARKPELLHESLLMEFIEFSKTWASQMQDNTQFRIWLNRYERFQEEILPLLFNRPRIMQSGSRRMYKPYKKVRFAIHSKVK